MAISPFVRRLREVVGNELLVLPSVTVLPRDARDRILLVRLVDSGNWATVGGAVEPDESPEAAARREAEEEAGVVVRLGPIVGVFGGPEYRVTYPNGDNTAYVVVVYDATVDSGTPRPDHDETSDVAWFHPEELPVDEMGVLTRALLRDAGVATGGG